MKNVLLSWLLFLCMIPGAWAFDHQHTRWADTLRNYRNDHGMIAYARLKEDTEKDPNLPFNLYLNELQAVTESEYGGWDQNQRKAFLINAYNALVIRLIIINYPVSSIKKIGGFMAKPWSVKFFKLLNGRLQKLDPLEHQYLAEFQDVRIHAVLNSAARSYPALRSEPYLPEQLDAQLDEQLKIWLSNTQLNEYDEASGHLKISRIFDWYEKDFDSWGGGIREVIRRYGPPSAVKALLKKGRVSYLGFDWGLNETP